MKNSFINDFKSWSPQYKRQLILQNLDSNIDLQPFKISSIQKKQLINHIELQTYSKGQTIFCLGEKVIGVYLLIKGQVLLLNGINNKDQQINQQKKTIIKNLVYIDQNSSRLPSNNKQTYFQQYCLKKRKQGIQMKRFHKLFQIKQLQNKLSIFQLSNIKHVYNSEGNIKLQLFKILNQGIFAQEQITQQNLRSTAICSQNTLLCFIPKQIYKIVFKQIIQQNIQIKKKFFYKLLQGICNQQITKQFMQIWTLRKLNQNQQIFRQGDTPYFVYIILKGKIKLQKMISDIKQNHKKSDKKKQKHKITYLTEGQLIGDDEVIMKSAVHFTDAKVQSEQSLIFQTPAKQFIKILKQFVTLKNHFGQIGRSKKQRRQQMYQRLRKIPNTSNQPYGQNYNTANNGKSISLRNQMDITNKIFKKSFYLLPQMSQIKKLNSNNSKAQKQQYSHEQDNSKLQQTDKRNNSIKSLKFLKLKQNSKYDSSKKKIYTQQQPNYDSIISPEIMNEQKNGQQMQMNGKSLKIMINRQKNVGVTSKMVTQLYYQLQQKNIRKSVIIRKHKKQKSLQNISKIKS